MIKVNLLAQARRDVSPKKGPSISMEGAGSLKNVAIVAMMLVTAGWVTWAWWGLTSESERLDVQIADAQERLKKVEEDRRIVDELEKKRAKVDHQIDLIAKLKRAQQVPVRLLDEISKNLPDFLWLTGIDEIGGSLTFSGRATTPTAYANFYNNLDASPYFAEVGKISYKDEGSRGVAFSLAATFKPEPGREQPAAEGAQ